MSAVIDVTTQWGVELQATGCPKCSAVYLVPPDRTTMTCPNCFAARLAPQTARMRAEPPELVAPFIAAPAEVTLALDRWARGVWLRPPELNASVLSKRLTRTFIPMWLVDGAVAGSWCAQMGYDYQVASSQEILNNDRWTTREVAETRVRWEPRAGQVERTYQNQPAPALEEYTRLMGAVGSYALDRSVPYSNQEIKEASVRVPDIEPDAARPIAEQGFNRSAEADCAAAAGAQHVEHWDLQAEYRNLNWTQLLLPLYTTTYTDEEGHIIPVMVHGQSGRISGVRRASQKQGTEVSIILGIAALVMFVLGLIAMFITQSVPAAQYVSGVLLLVGFGLAIAAPVPFIWAWQFNRQHE